MYDDLSLRTVDSSSISFKPTTIHDMMKLRALALFICSGQYLLSSVTRAEAEVCTDPETCGEDHAPPKKKRKQKVKTILERLGVDDDDVIPKQGRSAQKMKQKSPPMKRKKKQSQPNEDEDFMRHLENEVEVVPISELFKSLVEYQVYPTGTVTSTMQRYVERSLLAQSPPQESGSYVSFGSLLDLSSVYSFTWSGSTAFNGKVGWMSSLIHRKDINSGKELCDLSLEEDYKNKFRCQLPVTVDKFLSIRGFSKDLREEMEEAKEYGVLDKGKFFVGNIMELQLDEKFDTIIANGLLAAVDKDTDASALPMEDMDIIVERIVSLLKPGGAVYFIGNAVLKQVNKPAAEVYHQILAVADAAKRLSGEISKRDISADWVERTLSRLGLVTTSKLFPVQYSEEDVDSTVKDAMEWIEEMDASPDFKQSFKKMLEDLQERASDEFDGEEVYVGEDSYVVVGQLPSS